MNDRAPDYVPRVLTIFWAEGEDPKVEAPGFADWEIAALLREALNQFVIVTEDAEADG